MQQPNDRSVAASILARASWAQTVDRAARTAPARAAVAANREARRRAAAELDKADTEARAS